MEHLTLLVYLIFLLGGISLLSMVILHIVSPEFDPSWRMISEYALGKNKWLISIFFLFWGLATMLTAGLLLQIVESFWAKLGSVLVLISGIGAIMGGLFDVKHKLHGLSFMLGVPTLPIGALMVSYHLATIPGWENHKSLLLWSAHSLWMSVVLMAVTMMILFSGFKKHNIQMGPNVEPPKSLPSDVIKLSGYANRLLVLSDIFWLFVLGYIYLSF